jgi:hypothetical protein
LGDLDAQGYDLLRPREFDPRLVDAARRYFGGWKAALTAAGIDSAGCREHRVRSDAQWHEEFAQWVEEHGPLSRVKLANTGMLRLYTVAVKRYGGLAKAAQTFGLPFCGRTWANR